MPGGWFFKDEVNISRYLNISHDVSRHLKTSQVKKYYSIEDTIGAGNFAEVKKCSHRQTGEVFAVKVILDIMRGLHIMRSYYERSSR
eukprot:SAG31_NODE_3909_length_3762_cov_2.740923_1_plen_87_part_00